MSIADKLMKGAIDFHVHASPDPMRERRMDALDLARHAKEMGMRAIVLKCHQYGTAPLAYVTNRVVPDFLMVGSIVLNREVGGLNPEALEVAARMGAKVAWMPTLSSTVGAEGKAKETANPDKNRIAVITRQGKLVPEAVRILEIAKSYRMVIGTGHLSPPEVYAIVDEAVRIGVPVTVTHPLTSFAGSPLNMQQQKELTGKGAYIEHCFIACMPIQGLSATVMAEHIRAVGAERCILSTDFGQDFHPASPEGFHMMLASMLKAGLSEKELETMTRVNPSRLLGLE